jgi:hypothetical protein
MCNGPVQSDAEKQAQYQGADLTLIGIDKTNCSPKMKTRRGTPELLKQGHTPEETEKIIGAVEDYQREKSGIGSDSK